MTSYYTEFTEHPNYLHVRCFGVRSRSNGRRIVEDVRLALADSPTKRVLLDFRAQDDSTTVMQDFDQANYAASRLTGLRPKIGLLVRRGEFEDAGFWETVARNRGLWLRCFSVKQDAICWLLAGVPDNGDSEAALANQQPPVQKENSGQ